MDYKQSKILQNIYTYFHFKNKKKIFIQHRNLKEFRFFHIEKVNPTHRIILYGQLKRHLVKDKQYNKFIKAGEIILYSSTLFITPNLVIINLTIGIIVYSLFDIMFLHPIKIFKKLTTGALC